MKDVDTNVSFPAVERDILQYWKANDIFQRSMAPNLATTLGQGEHGEKRKAFVFYDGPPFATGLPHYGNILAGLIKDVIGRFFTMKGYYVERRFGWDCHGLPVEFEMQKQLQLNGAKEIREYGIAKFNEACRGIVLQYTEEWKRFVERSGRWVDMDHSYRTMDLDFMESIWWVIRRLWDRGLLYEGAKCVPYSFGLSTPLSNFEVNLNYKDVQDPAVTVRATLLTDVRTKFGFSDAPNWPAAVYIWTTTPWTLPSNLAMAVGPELEYVFVANPANKELVLMSKTLAPNHFPTLESKEQHADGAPYIVGTVRGSDLVGLEYSPFFPHFESKRAEGGFQIYPGDFVSEEDGTGVVHLASFGEDDVAVFVKYGLPIVDPLDENACFTDAVPEFAGLNVKDADPKVIAWLKERGALVQHRTIEHSYPFCYRTQTPLIYRSISTWFVKVEEIRDELVQMNQLVHWVPEHIRDGRMGKWLEGSRDWAISRNRFWGTPIPIWRCESCAQILCVGSVDELRDLTRAEITDIHSHFVDELTFPCGKCQGVMRRVPEVLDCWFESGSMPYAQAHYPFEGKEKFERNFPADFIGEGLDQTRGWFYTLLVLSTALFGRPAFKNVIVNGIILAEDGKKMSKSLKNFPPPDEVMEEIGADALRLYLLSSAVTRGEEIRFSKNAVRDVVRQTVLPLWNAYNFLVTYARVDGWTPANRLAESSPNLLDRWILSKMATLTKGVDAALSSYHLYAAAGPILDFVDQLTNWYIRLNRRRFWAGNLGTEKQDKLHAYTTLHRVLLSFARVLAPLAPFLSEEMFLNLRRGIPELQVDSVHLLPYPSVEEFSDVTIDADLEEAMELFEEVIILGRTIRNDHNLKVRQPLQKITVIHPNGDVLGRLQIFESYIREELNVKSVEYSSDEDSFVSLKAQLNLKLLGRQLGPKLGGEGMQRLREKVETLPTSELRALEAGERVTLEGVELELEHVLLKRVIKPGAEASASSGEVTVVLDTNLTQELRLEGLSREFVNRIQKLRKDLGLSVTDRIMVRYMTACSKLQTALTEQRDYVMRETLAVELTDVRVAGELKATAKSTSSQEIDGKPVVISITRIDAI
ncbi:MAG: isoleucine--tRNA ligase [Deltaproteobacteria bacterium]|nr:isoleucine--tRNA ligase [Deltaproteobacteria bacterium]